MHALYRMLGTGSSVAVVTVVASDSTASQCFFGLFGPREEYVATVVDCGSGHTSAFTFASKANGEVKILKHHRDFLPALDKSLKSSEAMAAWVQQLDEKLGKLSKLKSGPIFVGATAGLRHALKQGKVTRENVDEFQVRACLCFNPGSLRSSTHCWTGSQAVVRSKVSGEFRILSGEEEGLAELRAVRHVLADPTVGLVSGGGRSMQLGHGTGGGLHCISIPSVRTSGFCCGAA